MIPHGNFAFTSDDSRKINWRNVEGADINSIIQGNLSGLYQNLDDIAYANIETDDFVRVTPEVAKMHRVLQLGAQYLIYSHKELYHQLSGIQEHNNYLRQQGAKLHEVSDKQQSKIHKYKSELRHLDSQIRHYETISTSLRQRTIATLSQPQTNQPITTTTTYNQYPTKSSSTTESATQPVTRQIPKLDIDSLEKNQIAEESKSYSNEKDQKTAQNVGNNAKNDEYDTSYDTFDGSLSMSISQSQGAFADFNFPKTVAGGNAGGGGDVRRTNSGDGGAVGGVHHHHQQGQQHHHYGAGGGSASVFGNGGNSSGGSGIQGKSKFDSAYNEGVEEGEVIEEEYDTAYD